MAIFERLGDLIKANVNDLLDKAEDPEKMVKQLVIDMEKEVKEATQALGTAMASEKMAARQLEVAKKSSEDWENKAKAAIQAGKEDLARKALASKVEIDKNVASLDTAYQNISMQVSTLRDNVNQLRSKLEEARSRQNMIIARSKMADAQKGVAQSISGTNTQSAFTKLDKMERKVEEKEAQAAAFTEMNGAETAVTDEFADLEKKSAVDDELARLMGEMGKN